MNNKKTKNVKITMCNDGATVDSSGCSGQDLYVAYVALTGVILKNINNSHDIYNLQKQALSDAFDMLNADCSGNGTEFFS